MINLDWTSKSIDWYCISYNSCQGSKINADAGLLNLSTDYGVDWNLKVYKDHINPSFEVKDDNDF